MKRMELKICLTFAIIFVAGVILSGLYSVISLGASFFSSEVMTNALGFALVYLFYIWLLTRRHNCLLLLGAGSVLLFLIFLYYPYYDVNFTTSNNWSLKDWVMIVYYIIAFIIANRQSKKLLKEDELKIYSKFKDAVNSEEKDE